jgi:hypothetical protein
MKTSRSIVAGFSAILLCAATGAAQSLAGELQPISYTSNAALPSPPPSAAAVETPAAPEAAAIAAAAAAARVEAEARAEAEAKAEAEKQALLDSWKKGRPIVMQYYRAVDQRGINVFETTKTAGAEYTGFKFDINAGFTSQVQNLGHRNSAVPVMSNGVDVNQLTPIGFGFNNSTANLYLNAQLAPGVRVALTSYLSSRHHNETWVKDGYIQIDESPIDLLPLKMLFSIATVRVGHMEINYGDAHFRRSDNGNAIYNPFVGNYIMDAFTTEVGGEVYLKTSNVIAMGAITGGEIRGTVTKPGERGPAIIGKLGYDRQFTDDLRVRLTGSMYKTDKASSNTLYGGDRAGSRYYWVLENVQATEAAQAFSGLINPGFKNKVTALQVNPFVQFRGVELFGVIERAEGRASTEAADRRWNQYALDAVYRFASDKLFVGARYNKAQGSLVGITGDVGAKRVQVGGGWFILPGLLAKAEYVKQTYFGYPPANVKNGGRFDGLMLEGVVAF